MRDSRYGTAEHIKQIADRFDETTKRLFRSNKEVQFVSFGSPLDKDPDVHIRGGQLRLTGCVHVVHFKPYPV